MQTRLNTTAQPPTEPTSRKHPACSTAALLLGAAVVGALTGCVGYVEGPRHGGVYVRPAPVQVETTIVVQDDYVYYPSYQVYYSNTRRQYIYLEGRSWVTRPTPPRVSVDVLVASPSVRVDFHDAPAAHHATVVQTYPKHWTPPGWSHGNKGGNKEGHDEGHKKGKKGSD